MHSLGYVSAEGYDHNLLAEKRHPTRWEIDEVIADVPVALVHQSNHFGVFNSKAIELLGLQTEDGYLQETDFVEAVRRMPIPGMDSLLRCYEKAQQVYASYGITHVQDGMIVKEMVPIYQQLLKSDKLFLDIYGYASVAEREACAVLENQNPHFTLKGYKVILDGSPQGKTAWVRQPYAGSEGECAQGLMTDEALHDALQDALHDGKQLLAHCNGDAAAAQFIRVAKGFDSAAIHENRPVIVHGQLLGVDQLPEVASLGLIPSFFIAHVYHYGEVHLQNLGQQRAEQISPAASAEQQGIAFTFHQDSPVIPPDMLETIWCSVVRETNAGRVLGEAERISVASAVKAVTLNAAKQYGLEKEIGSLKAGKQANFVVLSQDIFQEAPETIRDTKVVKTYKNGQCIYQRG